VPGYALTTPAHGEGYVAKLPSTFFFNTADPGAWTRFQLEVTTFHDAIPGHHLQLALAQELDLHPILGDTGVDSR
jgi:uncharacterized protein (DUF885 family)